MLGVGSSSSSVVAAACVLATACMGDPAAPAYTGSLGGQVMVSGALREGRVFVDQLDLHTGEVYRRVGDTMTDASGRFGLPTRHANGLLRITVRGGSFEDLASGATIQLDPTDELTSLVWFELTEELEDALVSPIGHLIDARARVKLAALGDMTEAVRDASSHLGRHFGNITDWTRLRLVGLDQPATSPTEPVRAALVHAALGSLARDIAAEAGSSPQEVNVFELAQQWAADLGSTPPGDAAASGEAPHVFDGNDGNDRRLGSGLQLGACAPVEPACQVPADACNTGHCRRLCDLYVGTPRALLAGAMTKVIRDNGPGGVNQTGLQLQDTLAIARSISDNVDPDLFAGSCIETLDRTAPEVRWDEAHSAAADAVIRGVFTMKAVAIDDVDPRPRAEILGWPDIDGSPVNDVALARIDTATVEDGPLSVVARAVDLAGNSRAIERRLVVDNTAPQLGLSPAGFLVDGATWWTATAGPTLTGTIADANPAAVKATVGATQLAGTLSGETWSVTLPADAIDLDGADVTITALDRAGNQVARTQKIRRDATPPDLTLQPSLVHDEASEALSFAADEGPIHDHNGALIDLAASGACPTVTKHSYLLGGSSPTYVEEKPARNPIAYRFVSGDDGVGIVDGSTKYRVLRREAGGAAVVRDWTSAGAGTPIATNARQFEVAIVSDLVLELAAAAAATYDVELRTTDRLSRTTTTSRCFALRLKAPPLHFLGGGPAHGHALALDWLNLAPGAAYDQLAERLLNHNATGASLLDQWFVNGTTEPVFLTVTVTKPSSVTATQSFAIRNHQSTWSVQIGCGSEENPNPACDGAYDFPSQPYTSSVIATTVTSLTFPVKLYELNAAGVPTTEIPCLAPCSPGGTVFRFTVPPRAPGGAPARRFVAMTMIGQVSNLWPSDSVKGAAPPFYDTSMGSTRYTGREQFSSTGCVQRNAIGTACIRYIRRAQYRALTYARLDFGSETRSAYATAPTALLAPTEIAIPVLRLTEKNWVTSEGALP